MSFTRTAAAIVAVTTALTLGVPAATADDARPSRLVLGDATEDVWQEPEDEGPVQVDMPSADAVGAVAVHARHRLRITGAFNDLQQVDAQSYAVQLALPSKKTWNFTVEADAEDWEGRLQTGGYGPGGEFQGGCEAATYELDYDADTFSMVIPRGCLGRPEWVRVSLYNYLTKSSPEGGRSSFWDDPHNSDLEGGGITRRLYRVTESGDEPAEGPSRVELTDPTADVWTDGPGFVKVADVPAADVVRAVLAHRPHRFVIRMRFVDLETGGRQGYGAWLIAGRTSRSVWLDVNPRRPEGVLRIESERGRRVTCERARHDVDPSTDRVLISIPRGCLGRPDWVRGVLANYLLRSGYDAPAIYTDNPHNAKPYAWRPTPRLYVPAR